VTTHADRDLPPSGNDASANGARDWDDSLRLVRGKTAIRAHTDRHGQQVVVAAHLPRWKWSDGALSGKPGSAMIGWATFLLAGVGVLLFVISIHAQYVYVDKIKHDSSVAWAEATVLDLGMTIFSLLALGLSRNGQASRIERALIWLCAGLSALMNYAAADVQSPRSVLAYIMPPIFLAIVVDRVIAVIRRHVAGDDDHAVWSTAGHALANATLYTARLVIAPLSTLAGARRAVLQSARVPERQHTKVRVRNPVEPLLEQPGHRYALRALVALPSTAAGIRRVIKTGIPVPGKAELPADGNTVRSLAAPDRSPATGTGDPSAESSPPRRPRGSTPRRRSKADRFLTLINEEHGPLADIRPEDISPIAKDVAARVDLHWGTGRANLGAAVKAARYLTLVIGRHGPLGQIPLTKVNAVAADLAGKADLEPSAASNALGAAVKEAHGDSSTGQASQPSLAVIAAAARALVAAQRLSRDGAADEEALSS
jgi:hypothetical protein